MNLAEAAEHGDKERVQFLISQGANIHACDERRIEKGKRKLYNLIIQYLHRLHSVTYKTLAIQKYNELQ